MGNIVPINDLGEMMRGSVFESPPPHSDIQYIRGFNYFTLHPGFAEIPPTKYPTLFKLLTGCKTMEEWDTEFGWKVNMVESEFLVAGWTRLSSLMTPSWQNLVVWSKGSPQALYTNHPESAESWFLMKLEEK
jgi:hypothetical protein